MPADPARQLDRPALRGVSVRVATLAGAYALIGGLVTLVGWQLHPPRWLDWFGTGITMKANTALAAGLTGALLIAHVWAPSRVWLVRLPAALVATVGVATLLQHVSGVDLGIDSLVAVEAPGAVATAAPGRMGPPAATSLSALGFGLIFATLGGRARRAAAALGLVTIVIATLSLVGYLFGASQLFGLSPALGIALQTATMLAGLGVGLVAAVPERGLGGALARRGAGGLLLRRLLAAIIVVPVAFGWLLVQGERAGLYDTAFGSALLVLVTMSVLLALLAWTANGLNRMAAVADTATTALRASEERLRMALEASRTVAWSSDLRTGTVTYSTNAPAILGLSPDAITAGWSLVHRDDEGVLRDATARAVADRGSYSVDVRIVRPDTGDVVWMQHRGKVECDARGAAVRVLGTVTDITQRKQSEEALRAADRRKDAFLATLAHELRGPLAPLGNMLEVLKRTGAGSPAAAEARDVMERQMKQMVRLVDDLLDVSRITRDRLELRRERVDLGEVLRHALDTCAHAIEAGGYDCAVRLADTPIVVDADPVRLAQVFGNLLDNACKYSEPGGRIEVAVESDGREVAVSIRDRGIGIAPEMIPKVFDMFAQGQRPQAGSRGGLGIGLTLVRRLVEMHGGTITARSDGVGLGSEFIVRLPVAAPAARPAPARLDVAADGAVVAGRRVLVVDDNRDSAESLALLLSMSRHTTELAHDGHDAVAAAERFRPDAILLDVGLPGLTGYEVCRAVRDRPWGEGILIVAITGWGQEDDRRRSREAGFNSHLVKPVNFPEVLRLIADWPARAPSPGG
jgi:PAS domain S-box-containing protein